MFMSSRNLVGLRVMGRNHSGIGFIVSQIPDFSSGIGFQCKVAWDTESLSEAQ